MVLGWFLGGSRVVLGWFLGGSGVILGDSGELGGSGWFCGVWGGYGWFSKVLGGSWVTLGWF